MVIVLLVSSVRTIARAFKALDVVNSTLKKNGSANGYANGTTNGYANGHTNGTANGHAKKTI